MRFKLSLVLMLVLVLLLTALEPALARGRGGDDDDDDDEDAEPTWPIDTYGPSDSDSAALQWNEEALQCVRVTTPRIGPPVLSRSLFIASSAAYDAWAAYDSRAVPSIRDNGNTRQPSAERTPDNKAKAVSFAAYTALYDVFPTCRAEFLQQLEALGYTVDDTSLPATIGRTAADAVIAARRDDGANQAGGYADTSGYQAVNTPTQIVDPWRWQPLGTPHGLAATQRPLVPHWGDVEPFNAEMLKELQNAKPPSRQMKDTVDLILRYSRGLNDRNKSIAEYWADGPGSETPPGHWNVIAGWLSRKHDQTLDEDVRMFFGLNGAMFDASIACWETKFQYDFVRPITAVRHWRAGRTVTAWRGPGLGIGPIQGETWRPYQQTNFVTPPFPEYTSGHSSFSSAAAAFMKDFGAWTGRDGAALGARVTIPAGSSLIEPGITPAAPVVLSWPRFEDAAGQAGESRLHGGIHFDAGNRDALDMGKKLGEGAFSLAKKLWEGSYP